MNPKTKIGIIICDRYRRCAGGKCFQAMRNREGAFSIYTDTEAELVGVDEVPLEHQIRRSNVFTLVSLLEKLNIPSETAHITDDKPILKSNKSGTRPD